MAAHSVPHPSASASGTTRIPVKAVYAVEQAEGVGARVRRSIGSMSLRNLSPFLMLDDFTATEGAGFPDHPHRGQATVTYMLSGSSDHEDSAGNVGRLEKGDVQWMQAGRGIAHSEMPVVGPGVETPHGLQLWIDLPTAHKFDEPDYQELKSRNIPKAHPASDVEVAIISGVARGSDVEGVLSSPVKPHGGAHYYDVSLKSATASIWQPIPAGWTAFVYIIDGNISIGGEKHAKHHTIVLSSDASQDGVHIESASEHARLVLIAGEPLDQPIYQHGPFVVQSRQQAIEAIRDYQTGQNGFESALGWRSKIGAKLRSY